MRYGFTTGSCAAAAAKAAAYMLLTGKDKTEITIETPKGIAYHARLLDIKREARSVSCAVEKDSGDDPDITKGALIYAKVSAEPATLPKARVVIDGGIGVGRVTRPGLDQLVGAAAINHVPREMIEKEVLEVCEVLDHKGVLHVEIYVPEGEALAKKTFNPRLGIVGGISILGTSGIVEPMSRQALIDTIRVELRQRRAEGSEYIVISPGNYGQEFMKRTYGYDLEQSVKCSNFIGDTVDIAAELQYKGLLLTGHIGKLIKVAGGIMNTHSGEGDCRMEILAACCLRQGADAGLALNILDCATTEEALAMITDLKLRQRVMDEVVKRICFYLDKRAKGQLHIDCIVYANDFGELAKSSGAAAWFKE